MSATPTATRTKSLQDKISDMLARLLWEFLCKPALSGLLIWAFWAWGVPHFATVQPVGFWPCYFAGLVLQIIAELVKD